MEVWLVDCWECHESQGIVSVWTTQEAAEKDRDELNRRGKLMKWEPVYGVCGPYRLDDSFGFEAEDVVPQSEEVPCRE